MNATINTTLDNQVVGVFDGNEAATRAYHALCAAGLPDSAMRLVAAPEDSPAKPKSAGDQILDVFMGLFSSEQERRDHAAAVERGHAMLVVAPTDHVDREHVTKLLERSGAIDLAAKAAEWRKAAEAEPDGPES